ncbi:MAG TPA: non-heme iron oxygenase ferredoxin subunit [Acidobacteriota bacterium]|nr:non-heme iron oxygenase ferredoxin subunit [Acidobacteriota bacterium]
MPDVWIPVAKVEEIPAGEARVYTVGGRRVMISHVEGAFHAIDDTCTHDDGPLGAGQLDGCAIECPRHGARFDVRTGAVLSMPAAFPVRAYPTRVTEGTIEVDLGGAL